MELVLRAAAIFLVLFVIFRIAGNRQFSEMTAFDAVLILVVAEVTGNSLSSNDYSVTASVIVIATLVGLDVALSLVKRKWRGFERVADSIPALLVENGRPIRKTMHKERVDESDVLEAARETHGIESIDEIKYAVLERDGVISVIPKSSS